jgi:hypothetical protein
VHAQLAGIFGEFHGHSRPEQERKNRQQATIKRRAQIPASIGLLSFRRKGWMHAKVVAGFAILFTVSLGAELDILSYVYFQKILFAVRGGDVCRGKNIIP